MGARRPDFRGSRAVTGLSTRATSSTCHCCGCGGRWSDRIACPALYAARGFAIITTPFDPGTLNGAGHQRSPARCSVAFRIGQLKVGLDRPLHSMTFHYPINEPTNRNARHMAWAMSLLGPRRRRIDGRFVTISKSSTDASPPPPPMLAHVIVC